MKPPKESIFILKYKKEDPRHILYFPNGKAIHVGHYRSYGCGIFLLDRIEILLNQYHTFSSSKISDTERLLMETLKKRLASIKV